MPRIACVDVVHARNLLSTLVAAAESGDVTVITRYGKPIAALVPIDTYADRRQESLLPIAGSGRGLWRQERP